MPEFNSNLEFRDVEGFPDYKISNTGEIWSRLVGGWPGRIGKWKQLKPGTNPVSGHKTINLSPGQISFYVHRLVLVAFVGPCPEGLECCHFDDDPSNNCLPNLRWDTSKSNKEDMLRNGRRNLGARNGSALLNAAAVLSIRSEYANGNISQSALARKHGVHVMTINDIILRRTWKHIA